MELYQILDRSRRSWFQALFTQRGPHEFVRRCGNAVGEVKKSSVVVGGGAAATDVAQLIEATKQLLL